MKGVFPLNPLVLLNYARATVSKGLYCMNAQIRPEVAWLPHLRNVTAIPAEIWANYAETVTLPEMDESDGVSRDAAILTESSEPVAAKPLDKYIPKMILAEKAPVDTICLRRSSRATRYDGFKANIITDAKKPISRVKSRKAPAIASSSKATDPCSPVALKPAVAQSEDIPPNLDSATAGSGN